MKLQILLITHAIVCLFTANLNGQNFISKIPSVGTSALYDYETVTVLKNGKTISNRGVLSLNCVDKKKIDQRDYFGIELRVDRRRQAKEPPEWDVITKFYVHPSHLKRNTQLSAYAKQISSIAIDKRVVAKPTVTDHPLMLNTIQPTSTDINKQKRTLVKTGIGKLSCLTFTFHSQVDIPFKNRYTVLTNDQSPFGGVQLTIDHSNRPSGARIKTHIRIRRIEQKAKSLIPDGDRFP